MSTPTEEKTLGRIAYETHQNLLGDCIVWNEAAEMKRTLWESIAAAVIQSHTDRIVKLTNELYGNPPQPTVKQAEPWKLPEPPAGREWHRRDGWNEDMLPEGWRPLLSGEPCALGDKVRVMGGWSDGIDSGFPMSDGHLHTITRRPLPQPADPVGVKALPDMIAEGTHDLFMEKVQEKVANIEIQMEASNEKRIHAEVERDQLRKEVERLKRKWESDVPGSPGHRWRGIIEYIGSLTGCRLSSRPPELHLAEFVEGLQAKLASFHWKPVSEGMPTKTDGISPPKLDGHWVLWTNLQYGPWVGPITNSTFNGEPATHWISLPPLPPVPAETEDGEFSAWAEKHDYLHQGSVTIAAKAAWQAALASRNNNA